MLQAFLFTSLTLSFVLCLRLLELKGRDTYLHYQQVFVFYHPAVKAEGGLPVSRSLSKDGG